MPTHKEPTIADVIAILRGHEKRFDGIEQRFDGIDRRFDALDQTVDMLAINVVELKTDMVSVKSRLDRLENNQQRTFDRLDDFLGLYKKVDLEVVALRAKIERA